MSIGYMQILQPFYTRVFFFFNIQGSWTPADFDIEGRAGTNLPWLLRDDCTAIFLQITATFPCAHSFALSLPKGSGPEFIEVPPCLGIVLPSPSPFSPLVAQTIKNLPAMQDAWVQSLGQKAPRRREWHPTPVFLPGGFYGERSLADYSPQGC